MIFVFEKKKATTKYIQWFERYSVTAQTLSLNNTFDGPAENCWVEWCLHERNSWWPLYHMAMERLSLLHNNWNKKEVPLCPDFWLDARVTSTYWGLNTLVSILQTIMINAYIKMLKNALKCVLGIPIDNMSALVQVIFCKDVQQQTGQWFFIPDIPIP